MAPDDGFLLDATQANQAYTVMAYRTAPQALVYEVTGTARNYTATTRQIYPETPMLLDIAVLQTLYGANTSAHPGNDVYRWETNPVMLQALWDAGGVDTIDCSNQVLRCVVNLTPRCTCRAGSRNPCTRTPTTVPAISQLRAAV